MSWISVESASGIHKAEVGAYVSGDGGAKVEGPAMVVSKAGGKDRLSCLIAPIFGWSSPYKVNPAWSLCLMPLIASRITWWLGHWWNFSPSGMRPSGPCCQSCRSCGSLGEGYAWEWCSVLLAPCHTRWWEAFWTRLCLLSQTTQKCELYQSQHWERRPDQTWAEQFLKVVICCLGW